MSRTTLLNKDTGGSTFYNTAHSDYLPFSLKRRLISANSESIELLSIEAESKMDKLREKIAADEGKV
jgi:hypothetical protein